MHICNENYNQWFRWRLVAWSAAPSHYLNQSWNIANWTFGNKRSCNLKIYIFPFKKKHLKMSLGKWWPFCYGLNVLNHVGQTYILSLLQSMSAPHFCYSDYLQASKVNSTVVIWGPFYWHGVELIPAWIRNYTQDWITYLFTNLNGRPVEVWTLISNFIPHFIMDELLIHAGIKVNPY